MEQATRVYVDKWLPSTDVCQCENCRLDIMAIMLNNLRPHYIVTEKGNLFAQMNDFDPQHRVDLMSSFSHAVGIVKGKPQH